MTVTSEPTSIDALTGQLGLVHYVLKTNVEGLTHEESLAQPTPGGNCLNWVVGHLMTGRNGALQLLGMAPLWDDATAETYKRGSPPLTDPAKALPFEKIMADFDASQTMLLDGLRRLPPERLGDKAPFSPTNNPDETVGSLLAGIVFHDAYHTGQTGLLRRLVGKQGAVA